jgi:hypothetical protein
MRRVITGALLGFAVLGWHASNASAWPLESLFRNHGCCAKICCKQYNAFSPFCCEGVAGSGGMPGYGDDSAGYCLAGDQGYVGDLPAPGANGTPVPNAPAGAPTNGKPATGASTAAPRGAVQLPLAGAAPQPLPAWGSGFVNPPSAPGYYPGFTGYGPVNGNGFPSYYPGATSYGIGNGTTAPSYNPGFINYGPANGFGR